MKVLLDTSFLIQLKKKNPIAESELKKCKDIAEDIIISSITIYELLAGAHYVYKKHGTMKEMKQVELMTKFLTQVPVDSEIAWRAAKTRADLQLKGQIIPDIDLIIACTEENIRILTFDSDFAPLKKMGFDIKLLKNTK
jgi:predicted nucleic acid-binding protein